VLETLRGKRLGKHERRLLLEAPPNWRHAAWRLEPPAPGRSADESRRRARRRLHKMGLLHRTGLIVRTDWGTRYATGVYLTALGAAVQQVCGPQLESGRPIRWAQHAEAIAAAWPRYREQEAAREQREEEEWRELERRAAAMGVRL
jgi:hypothetical protein